jgi:hypothetical protein
MYAFSIHMKIHVHIIGSQFTHPRRQAFERGMYIYIHTYIYIYVYMYVRIYVCTNTCMTVYMYTNVFIHLFVKLRSQFFHP